VAALNSRGIGWAAAAINIVIITAILSTMLAAMFGIGRMMRSLAAEGMAPSWLKDKKDVPYRGILFSGIALLLGMGLGFLLPRVYLFLISSGGFALLFTYAVIMATHIRFRKKNGCPPDGKCQLWGFPYSSVLVLISLVVIILSMPFVPGQASGLMAGIIIIIFYILVYTAIKIVYNKNLNKKKNHMKPKLSTEFSQELADTDEKNNNIGKEI
jgi:L-asparagine transporter-like permease